nr:MAG TPA: hypothetical protein [Caudoviricetes sp.]
MVLITLSGTLAANHLTPAQAPALALNPARKLKSAKCLFG